MNTILLTDSCCDLPLELVMSHKESLEVIGMPIHLDGTDYIDDLGKTLPHDIFYQKLRNGIRPTTAQINVFRFTEIFKKYAQDKVDTVYLAFTSGMSGTYNSAQLAKNLVLEEFPEAQIHIVDTLSASIGLGALTLGALDLIKDGASAQAIAQWAETQKTKTQHWFGVDDLQYLKNGGRISSTSAMLGTMLNVKPTLIVDHEGKLKPYGNVRGRKKSIAFLAGKLEEHFDAQLTTRVLLGHGNCFDDALALKEAVSSKHPHLEIVISELSMTIASHVGPNMLAVAFIGDERTS